MKHYESFFSLQDLQAEVDANKGTYDSLNTAGNQLTRTMVAADAQRLQKRLEEMNQRWINLMTKSMEIRYLYCRQFVLYWKKMCIYKF